MAKFIDAPACRVQVGGIVLRHADRLFERVNGVYWTVLPREELAKEEVIVRSVGTNRDSSPEAAAEYSRIPGKTPSARTTIPARLNRRMMMLTFFNHLRMTSSFGKWFKMHGFQESS